MNLAKNILIFPGGTEIGLEIHSALRLVKGIRLFTAGCDASTHAKYVCERDFFIPPVTSSDWLPALSRLVQAQKIDYIFPAHDDVVVSLMRHAESVAARIVSSPLQTCLTCRSKTLTYHALEHVAPVPNVYQGPELVSLFPVFVKPDRGEGSRRARIVREAEELRLLLREEPDLIISEYLPGEEYTIDCFSDREGGLLFCSGRERIRTRNGISVDSKLFDDPEFKLLALAITQVLVLHGAWFFQVKRDCQGALKIMEIAPRIAGTMALNRVLGVNFPLLSIYECERLPVRILPLQASVEINRALINRYQHDLSFEVAYVDLDDTVILNGKVNLDVVRFLYQCVNNGIRLVLLTRHAGVLEEVLIEHRLLQVFDELVQVPSGARKVDFISNERASILIDDSFRERQQVQLKLGIPTFDCSMLEMLIDYRT
jgi:hypothetical protein